MEYKDYICRTCGFSSLEKPGAYKCPKCGSIMEVANHSMYNDDKTTHSRNSTTTILAFVFGLPFCLLFCIILLRSIWGAIPGVIIFIILLMLLPSDTKDKAIPVSGSSGYCWNCGVELKDGDDSFCGKCGDEIKKE